METRSGTKFLCDMPGEGPWRMTFAFGGLIATSPACGTFRLFLDPETTGIGAYWEKIDARFGDPPAAGGCLDGPGMDGEGGKDG